MKFYNKYKNKKTVIDGIKFSSKKEAIRYSQLKILQANKEISDLKLQPKFLLQEKFIGPNGEKIRDIHYIADFLYIDKERGVIVEDVKGIKTEIYKLKRKLFLKNFHSNLTFVEI